MILILYVFLENCVLVFNVTMKRETIRKSNIGIAIFEIILELKIYKNCVYIHSFASLWHIALFAVCALFQTIVLCLISVKQMHTFNLLNMCCQYIVLNVWYVMSRKMHCRKVLYCDTNEISTINIISVGPSTKHIYMNTYNKSRVVIEPFQYK